MNKSILFDRKGRSLSIWLFASFMMTMMFFASCADGFQENDPFTSDVQNSKLSSPDSITFTKNADGTNVTITWPVVYGAGGYQFTVYNVDDPTTPVVIGTENDTIDGCSVTMPISEDTKYKVLVKSLGNTTYNNTIADSAKVAYFTTLIPSYATIPSGDLYEYFQNHPIPTTPSEIVYDLEAGGTYTMSGDVELPVNVDITIRGDKVDHAALTMSSGTFISDGAPAKFKWMDFDCTSFTGTGLLTLNSTVNTSDLASAGGYGIIQGALAFQSCKITGLATPLIYDNAKKYAIQTVLIKDCIIQQNTMSSNLISLLGGFAKDLTITNSTVYNLQKATGGYMIQYGNGASVAKVNGEDPCRKWANGSVTLTNSTFWQIVYAKQMANYSGMSKNFNTLTVKYCIFQDCGSSQVIRRLAINTSMGRKMDYNSYWYDGAFASGEISSSYDNSSTYISDDPGFVDPANGNFRTTGAGQVANKTGDPRWFE